MRVLWHAARAASNEPAPRGHVDLTSEEGIDAFIAAELRPPTPGRPWLAVNMVTSLDGATAITGRSSALQTPADKAVFLALRAAADVVLAGAGTVRVERYGPARMNGRRRAVRRARGQAEVPAMAIVSGSLDLDPAAPVFTAAEERTIVLTVERADPDRRKELEAVADVAVCGVDQVEPHLALDALADRGARFVLCEGGPRLNGDLVTAGLIDEWCLSLAPQLVAGDSLRAAIGMDVAGGEARRLDRVLEDNGMLLLRYLR